MKLSQQPRRPFQNPFSSTNEPLGGNGKRAYVPGQESLRVGDYGIRADRPGAGWRILHALDEVRKKACNKAEQAAKAEMDKRKERDRLERNRLEKERVRYVESRKQEERYQGRGYQGSRRRETDAEK